MIDIPEVRYALIGAVVLLVMVAWWGIRSQFGWGESGTDLLRRFRRDGPRQASETDRP